MKIRKMYRIPWWLRIFLWGLPLEKCGEIDVGEDTITYIGYKYWRGVCYVVEEKVARYV